MAKLILIRHGQTDWNKQNRIQGALDIPLNHEGKKEAQDLARELAHVKIDAVYSSAASCSVSTASEIAQIRDIKVKIMPELNELDHSAWQGLLLKDVKKRYKKQYALWKSSPDCVAPPKGETLREAYDRAISALRKILDRHRDENICIVSHDIVLSIIKCHLNNISIDKVWDTGSKKAGWEAFDL